ncbi:MAG: hypothetical protein AAGK14_04500 [Verrucomicrobiota bacterium]
MKHLYLKRVEPESEEDKTVQPEPLAHRLSDSQRDQKLREEKDAERDSTSIPASNRYPNRPGSRDPRHPGSMRPRFPYDYSNVPKYPNPTQLTSAKRERLDRYAREAVALVEPHLYKPDYRSNAFNVLEQIFHWQGRYDLKAQNGVRRLGMEDYANAFASRPELIDEMVAEYAGAGMHETADLVLLKWSLANPENPIFQDVVSRAFAVVEAKRRESSGRENATPEQAEVASWLEKGADNLRTRLQQNPPTAWAMQQIVALYHERRDPEGLELLLGQIERWLPENEVVDLTLTREMLRRDLAVDPDSRTPKPDADAEPEPASGGSDNPDEPPPADTPSAHGEGPPAAQ